MFLSRNVVESECCCVRMALSRNVVVSEWRFVGMALCWNGDLSGYVLLGDVCYGDEQSDDRLRKLCQLS